MKRLLLSLLLVLLLPLTGWGATYYVRQDGEVAAANKANATGCGAASTAMNITQHNAATFAAGDTIYLCSDGGDFTGVALIPPTSGGAASYITYSAAPGETPWLDGTGLTSTVVISAGRHYLNLVNLSFKGTPTQHIAYAGTHVGTLQNPHFTGAPTYAAIKANNPTLTVTNLNVSSFTSDKILYWESTTNANTITGGTITAALSGRSFLLDNAANITITGLTATISTNAGNEPGSFFYANTNNAGTINITNNNITYNLTAGAASDAHIINILTGTRTVNVTGNTITCASTGQTQSAIHVVNQPTVNITGNTIAYGKTGSSGFVIDVTATSATGAVNISNNTITSAQTGGVVLLVGSDTTTAGDNLLDGAIISGNTITTPLVSGETGPHLIECGYNKNCLISKNFLTGGRHGVVIKGSGNEYTSGGVIQNICVDQGYDNIYVKGQKNVPIYNNTLYVSSNTRAVVGLLLLAINSNSANVPATGAIVKNNVFYGIGGRNTVSCDADSATGLAVDNNLHYMATGAASVYATVGATTYTTWADWQTAGYDTNGVNGNPLFRSTSDYRLRPGSPAINAGTDVGLTTDYLGKPIRGTPDIGAYEFQHNSRSGSLPIGINIGD